MASVTTVVRMASVVFRIAGGRLGTKPVPIVSTDGRKKTFGAEPKEVRKVSCFAFSKRCILGIHRGKWSCSKKALDITVFCFVNGKSQTSLVFSVGEEEVPNFRMVERHYFRDQVSRLITSYRYDTGENIRSSENKQRFAAAAISSLISAVSER